MDDLLKITVAFDAGAAKALAGAPGTLFEELERGVTEASLLLEREAKEAAPTSTGLLRDSIAALPVRIGVETVEGGVGTGLAYAAPVELGAKPHMPPLEPIVDWVKRTFDAAAPSHYNGKFRKRAERAPGQGAAEARRSAAEAEALRIAEAIRWKIYHKGTKARAFMGGALARCRPQIDGIIGGAFRRAVERLGGGK